MYIKKSDFFVIDIYYIVVNKNKLRKSYEITKNIITVNIKINNKIKTIIV